MKVRTVLEFAVLGVAWGWTCLALLLLGRWCEGGADLLRPYLASLPVESFWSAVTGLGFVLPALLYRVERPSLPAKILIHFLVGMGIYLPVAFSLGWIPPTQNGWMVFGEIGIGCAVFSGIWCIFFLINRYEAREINRRVSELAEEEKNKGESEWQE